MKKNKEHTFIPYKRPQLSEEEMEQRSEAFYDELNKRRTVREFSDAPIPQSVINNILKAASTAPSGANKQPWKFCLISNKEIKRQIRLAAEEEEKINYNGRMNEEWLEDLAPFATTWEKPFLEIAPYLIVVMKQTYELKEGEKRNNYYVNESVGLATGMLIAAIHQAGLVSLTHTPSPMNFLIDILNRPKNEKPFLLIPVGYPKSEVLVPDIKRKSLSEIAQFYL